MKATSIFWCCLRSGEHGPGLQELRTLGDTYCPIQNMHRNGTSAVAPQGGLDISYWRKSRKASQTLGLGPTGKALSLPTTERKKKQCRLEAGQSMVHTENTERRTRHTQGTSEWRAAANTHS